MVRGKRPVRGGKRKFDAQREHRKGKSKKGKFDIRDASYVKERDAKNAEIENRRKKLNDEQERRRKREVEISSDEEEENPMAALLSTFSASKLPSKIAIESETESEEDSDEEKLSLEMSDENAKNVDIEEGEDSPDLEESEEEDSKIEMTEKDEEDAETAREEDTGHLRDPFSIHLNKDLSEDFYRSVSSVPQITRTEQITWPVLGKMMAQIPILPPNSSSNETKKSKLHLAEEKQYAKPSHAPEAIENIDWNKLYVKSQIQANIERANAENITKDSPLTPLQRELFSVINNYQDFLYTGKNNENADELRFVYCLHAINHALKTRTKILHHNAKLSKAKKSEINDIPDDFRDQGLVRPKILIVVPFRHSCLKIVECLIAILIGEDKGGSVVNKKRFLEDYGSGNEIAMPKKNPKPEDYETTFKGNTDDTFKIGISITKKTLKLYTDFYSSDIIISSFLGLRMLIGAEGEEDRDYDFLASLELLIVDQTEIFLMQNWDHVLHVMNYLHLQPRNSHDTDFSRVRNWCVNGWSKYYRQTIVISSLNVPEVHGIFNKKCHNHAGKIRTVNPCLRGSICQVIVQVPQIFHKFEATSHSNATLQSRFDFFVKTILPQYKDSMMNHTLIYVPSYFDFVKLRNYMKKEEYSFGQICEYSKDAKVARARDMFFHSDTHFLVYSERFHFFRRVRIKGIRHIIFYEPPTFPHLYDEMCNLMQEAYQNPRSGSESNMTITTLYCKYDAMKIGAIVGSERAIKMIASDKYIHMIMTGD